MKKIFLMLGTALLALTSCSESEVLDVVEKNKNAAPIGFAAMVGKQTRAAEDTGNNATNTDAAVIDTTSVDYEDDALVTDNTVDVLKGNSDGNSGGFYLIGGHRKKDPNDPNKYVYTKQFTGGEKSVVRYKSNASGTTGSWQYSSIVYFWQEDAEYRYAAFAPKLSNGTASYDIETNMMTISDFVADGKTDLLVTSATKGGSDYLLYSEYVTTTNGVTTTGNIPLAFKHALAKVRFVFVNQWHNAVKVSISNVELKNVKSKGTLFTDKQFSSENIALSEWSTSTATTDGQVSENNGTVVYKPGKDWSSTTTGETFEFENFLIPQDLVTGTDGKSAITLTFMVELLYDGYEQGPDIAGPNYSGSTPNIKTITATLPVDKETEKQWLPGYVYTYKVGISADTFGLRPIKFELLSVDGWDTGFATDIDVKSPAYVPEPK